MALHVEVALPDLDVDKLAKRDSVCADSPHVTQEFADTLGLSLPIAQGLIDQIEMVVGGEPSWMNLEQASFDLLRQKVVFELECIGHPVPAARKRELIRVCQSYNLRSIAHITTFSVNVTSFTWTSTDPNLPNGYFQRPILLGPERVAVQGLGQFLADEERRRKLTATAQPIKKIDLPTAFKAHGILDGFEDALKPPLSAVEKVILAQEQKRRALPWFDVRLAPWVDESWKLKDGKSPGAGPGPALDLIQQVGDQFDAALDHHSTAGAGSSAVTAATWKRATEVQDVQLSCAHHTTALGRFLSAVAVTGAFGPHGILVVYGYQNLVLELSSCHGHAVAIGYDTRTRKKAAESPLERGDLVKLLLKKDRDRLADVRDALRSRKDQLAEQNALKQAGLKKHQHDDPPPFKGKGKQPKGGGKPPKDGKQPKKRGQEERSPEASDEDGATEGKPPPRVRGRGAGKWDIGPDGKRTR